jgi:hypothetical protein
VRVSLDPLVELRGASGETCLFGEGPGGFVVSGSPEQLKALHSQGNERGVDVLLLGSAGGEALEISAAETDLSVPLADAERAWRSLRPR